MTIQCPVCKKLIGVGERCECTWDTYLAYDTEHGTDFRYAFFAPAKVVEIAQEEKQ